AGDVLFEIRSEDVNVLRERLRGTLDRIARQRRLDELVAGRHQADLDAARARQASLDAEARIEAERARTLARIHAQSRALVARGVAAAVEVERSLLAHQEAQRDAERARRAAVDAGAALHALEVARQEELDRRAMDIA